MGSLAAAPSSLAVSPLQMAAHALDLLDREDPADLPATALGEEIEALFTIQNRVAAAITRRVAVFDRGKGCAAYESHSTAAWLKRQVRLAPNAASEQVRVARQLDRHPEAWRNGGALPKPCGGSTDPVGGSASRSDWTSIGD